MILGKYSIGIGDRFGRQGRPQLAAILKARQLGVAITPVWNKSYREHTIIASRPADVRAEADRAVRQLAWPDPYFVDADHINLSTVDAFIDCCDFFTIDVADAIGQPPQTQSLKAFTSLATRLVGTLNIPGIDRPLEVRPSDIARIGIGFLAAVEQAAAIYRHIRARKTSPFVVEVSFDEAAQPQGPIELMFILMALGRYQVPVRTIAPKFTGRFNKGVDYVGNLREFERQFNDDLAVISFAAKEFGLPADLKLSVHSGSDKFSIYAPIRRALGRFDAGLHIKTAGTTWLEELTGLAQAGGEGLAVAQAIYSQALVRIDELCAPYATVIDIDRTRLPSAADVARWDGPAFAAALRHDPACPAYNPSLRQLLHVAYKVAAEMGPRFLDALDANADAIGACVTQNIFDRHIKPLFLA